MIISTLKSQQNTRVDITTYKPEGWTIKEISSFNETKGWKIQRQSQGMENKYSIFNIYVIEFPEEENKRQSEAGKTQILLKSSFSGQRDDLHHQIG